MPWEPRWPRATAMLVCSLAALTLLWPLLTGQILFGGARSDMFIAGYSFRLFGATEFLANGHDSAVESLPLRRSPVHRRDARRHLLSDRLAALGHAGRSRHHLGNGASLRARRVAHLRFCPRPSDRLDCGDHRRRRVRTQRNRRLTDESGPRRQALRLGADPARLLGTAQAPFAAARPGRSASSAWSSRSWSWGTTRCATS